ncbi:flagellar basal body L-ring protein FlgH [Desulfobacter sp.]|uniref:flagellar basal body L-ring protein FlgH n=1 Tax=Desulfobacter sp. TaxID=2294 RepID=UPI000E8B222A|nr:flagellar basal body L-ring protein FlgH [Desulfobacter sp.]MBP8828574.1 flagellar basal body L-ring protein FlgH [Desulfobacter sp.]MBP9597521.1 flagellar basal body L-ring protein FlgH [Desulfobacter sp.]HBT89969.1 flagellin biosynthesis protein FlgH [Desulfobacter sp.]
MQSIHKQIIRGGVALLLTLMTGTFTGCMSGGGEPALSVVPQETIPAPAVQPEYTMAKPVEGSLWTAQNRFLLDDTKAAYVGDTVIVDIVENASSEMEVNSEGGRATNMSVGVPTLNAFGKVTHLGGGSDGGNLIDTSFENSTKGEAASDRSGQVTASIAARVTEVMPNGNLSIFGRRAMKVDNEVQYIMVSGIVRPEDIDSDNRVESTSLADSRIEYYGRGALADKQKPGWGTRIIDNIWPW